MKNLSNCHNTDFPVGDRVLASDHLATPTDSFCDSLGPVTQPMQSPGGATVSQTFKEDLQSLYSTVLESK